MSKSYYQSLGLTKTNYHTHTNFCDGKDSPREMVLTALEKNFNILGFSGHSMYPFAVDWSIGAKNHGKYADQINQLKVEFKDRIQILLGFEADYFANLCTPVVEKYKDFNIDYLIGAVHFVPGNGGFFEADGSLNSILDGIKKYFKGNKKLAVQTYFEYQREMLSNGNFHIIAHPDLISKQNKFNDLFNPKDSWYKKELKLTAKAIAKNGCIAEINTGAIARGYLDTPYPSTYFLELLKENNVPVTINSDCHNKDYLDFWFEEGISYIKKAGYNELHFITTGGVKSQKI